MAEEQQNVEQTQQPLSNLASAVWGNEDGTMVNAAPETIEQHNEEIKTETKVEETKVEETKEEVIDANEYLKTNLGYDNWEDAKQDIEQWRKVKGKPVVEFPNEESKAIYENLSKGDKKAVLEILEKQAKLESILSSEVSKDNAAEIVKMNMREKYKDLTPAEIEYKFNKTFGVPQKPVQLELEDSDEYADRVAQWEAKVRDIETDLVIEAKTLKPELGKLKQDLVFPNIQQESPAAKEPSQEELEAFTKQKETFLQAALTSVNSFNGFSAEVKDNDVNYKVSYELSKEEKAGVESAVKVFTESGFDANAVLAQRWLKQDGTLNEAQIVKDMALLFNEEKISQKYVTDAASKRLDAFLKDKKNITIGQPETRQTFSPDAADPKQQLAEQVWAN